MYCIVFLKFNTSVLQLLLPAQSAKRSLRKVLLCRGTNGPTLPTSRCSCVPKKTARPTSPQPLTWSTTFARCICSCWNTSVPSLTAPGCLLWGWVLDGSRKCFVWIVGRNETFALLQESMQRHLLQHDTTAAKLGVTSYKITLFSLRIQSFKLIIPTETKETKENLAEALEWKRSSAGGG